MGRAGALSERVIAGVGEVVAVGVALASLWNCLCNGIVGVDPHGRCVGDGGHGGLRALLLLAVDYEEEQKEEHEQHQHYDPRDDSDLVGVHWQGRAGQAIQGPHNDNTSLVTSGSFPSRVAVARPSHVVTGGVVETFA